MMTTGKKALQVKPITVFIIGLLTMSAVSGCLPYLYHERAPALIEGVDIDQTLKVAQDELNEGGGFSVLTIWAIRDQMINSDQAKEISRLYFSHIDTIASKETKHRKFGIWHFTWAIANLYRFGDEDVKSELKSAYQDAKIRVKEIDRSYAEEHVSGDKMYTGWAHVGGRAYARNHLVVPGNEDFLQSYKEYVEKERGS